MPYSILEITNGTVRGTVSFIAKDVGLHLKSWSPAINPFKEDGVWQDSSQGPGRRLVQAEFANATESFIFDLNGRGQDSLIFELTRLIELLLAAISYWETEKGDPIYIKAKSPCETGIRYCEVRGFSIPGLKNPYAAPFFVAQELAAMDEIELNIERLFWLANPPGVGECLPISSQEEWTVAQEILATNINTPFIPTDMVEADNGDLFLSTSVSKGTISRSQNGGVTWGTVATAGFTANQHLLRKSSNGYLFLGRQTGELQRSVDNGATWASVSGGLGGFPWGFAEYLPTATLFAGGSKIRKSVDQGATWSLVLDLTGAGGVNDIFVASNNYIFATTAFGVLRSVDGGTSWTIVFNPTGYGWQGTIIENSRGLFLSYDGAIFFSSDFGDRWGEIFVTGFGDRSGGGGAASNNIFLRKLDDNNLYAQWGAGIFKSTDGGLTWANIYTPPAGYSTYMIYITPSGDIFIGEADALGNNHLLTAVFTTSTFGGEAEDCDGIAEVFITNKFAQAQLTHVKLDDGGVFTDLMPMTVFPVTLYPASPAVDDALYFISDTSLNQSGIFSNIALYLSTTIGLVTAISYTIVWEYWDGAAWTALPNIFDGSFQFNRIGPSSVHFTPPLDWVQTTVDGATGWIIRARVSALSGTISPPEQGVRPIFIQNNAFAQVERENVAGDIPALLRMLLFNVSDEDGRSGDANWWANRVIVGLRSFEEANAFQAYINISDVQTPFGVSVALGADTTFVDDNTAPTGRRAEYAPAGVEAMATRATVTLTSSIARDYYGSFHVYLRGQRLAGVATDISVRLQIITGSGGISFTTETKQFQTTTQFEILDFGQVDIPVSGAIKDDEIPDTMQIVIQASSESATPDFRIYDLVFIPVDEWALDSVDITNSNDSILGRVLANLERHLDIDSITYPVLDIRTVIKDANEKVASIWNPITGGEAVAQQNIGQRYWFLCAQTSATGTSYNWIAPPRIAHSVQTFKNERYLALRGDR